MRIIVFVCIVVIFISCSNNRKNEQNQYAENNHDIVVIETEGNTKFTDEENIKSGHIIIQAGTRTIQDEQYREMNIFSIDIPDTVTYIGDFAFWGNELEEVILPKNLTEIGIGAFRNNKLKSITIPDTVKNITIGAFANNRLVEIHISRNIEFIFTDSFSNNLLSKIIIPDSVKMIMGGAFTNNRIIEISIGENVELRKSEYRNNIFGEYCELFCEYYIRNNMQAGSYRYNEEANEWELL